MVPIDRSPCCTLRVACCISVRYMLHIVRCMLHILRCMFKLSVACCISVRCMLHILRCIMHIACCTSVRCMLHQRPLHVASVSVACRTSYVALCTLLVAHCSLHVASASVACRIGVRCMLHRRWYGMPRRVPLLGVQVFDGAHELPEEVLPRHPPALAQSPNRARRVPPTAFSTCAILSSKLTAFMRCFR